MTYKTQAKQLLRIFSYVFVLLVMILVQNIPAIGALSEEQEKILRENIHYFNIDTCDNAPSALTNTSANNKIYVIGDSLTVGMRDAGNLQAKLTNAGWDVTGIEATAGISIDASIPKVEADAGNAVSSAGTFIVGLGTNRSADPAGQIDKMIAAIHAKSANATIFWINAYSSKDSYTSFNKLLTDRESPGKIDKVLDWAHEAATGGYTLDPAQGIHPSPAGYIKRSAWVVSGIGSPPTTGAAGTLNLSALASKYNLQSVEVKELGGAVVDSFQADQPPAAAASVLKLLIADVLLHNSPNLSKQVTVTSAQIYAPGDATAGQTLSLKTVLTRTLSESSWDTGANILIDEAGGLSKITADAHKLGYSNTNILNFYHDPPASPPNTTTAADLTKAMEDVFTNSSAGFAAAQDAMKGENHFGISPAPTASKWGGTSKVSGNSALFDVGGKQYIITMYINGAHVASPPSTAFSEVKAATEDILAKLKTPIAGTAPTATPTPATSATPAITLTADQKIAGTFVIGFTPGTPKATIENIVDKYKIGGIFILGTTDAAGAGFDKAFFDKLNTAAGHSLVIASDEEGIFQRYKYPFDFPSAKVMGALSDTAVTDLGKKVGAAMLANGVNTDLAPVVDVAKTASDTVAGTAGRAFSDDPAVVTAKAGAFAAGLRAGGVNPVLKHFPGLGSTSGNSDTTSVTSPSLATLKATDLKPYETLANQNGAGVMLDNAHVPGLTGAGEVASISPDAVKLLRTDYNFKGLITTDDLTAAGVPVSLPAAITKALQAGVDMPLFAYKGDASIDSAISAAKTAGVSTDASLQRISDFVGGSAPVTPAADSLGCCPPDGASASATPLTGKTNAEKVWNYFIGKGLTNLQVAAIMGNLQQESGFKTTATNPGVDHAFGIGQWLGARKAALLAKANYTDLGVQLDFMWDELNGPPYKSNVLEPLQAEKTNLSNAVDIWLEHYEIPCNPGACGSELAKRLGFAISWLNNASGGAGANAAGVSIAASDPSGCSAGAATPTGPSGYSNPFHDMSNLVANRIDEGVDFAAKPGTKVGVFAIGNGTIKIVTDKSTFATVGGRADWITYQLSDGPAKDKYIYVSEACIIDPDILSGKTKTVTSATHLCDALPASIETGWALDASSQAAAAVSVYHGHDGFETAYGVNFNDLLVSLGAPAGHLDTGSDPSGTILGTLPAGWPTWK